MIHAVYLINCATKDKEMRKKSIASLTHALQMGDAIGADGVVVHPGSTVGEPHAEAIERAGSAFVEALKGSDSCPLLLEDTAGSGNTLGRDFTELRDLVEAAGGDKRIGICLDSCHMLASGFDITTADKLDKVIDECVELIGTDMVRCLHVNDSKTPLGSNVDRHAVAWRRPSRRQGLRRVPLRAALRGTACAVRGTGRRGQGARARRRRQDEGATEEGPRGA